MCNVDTRVLIDSIPNLAHFLPMFDCELSRAENPSARAMVRAALAQTHH